MSSARSATAGSRVPRSSLPPSGRHDRVPRCTCRARRSDFTVPTATKKLTNRTAPVPTFSRSFAANARRSRSRSTSAGVRRAIVRTGIVLAPGAGALKIMTPLFKLGPGVPIGSSGGFVAHGQQWMSWIHIDDIVGIFRLALENAEPSGPLNGTAPEPVRNAEFAKTFSSVLRTRFTPWRVFIPFGPPDAVLRLMLGDVAGVITTGQRSSRRRRCAGLPLQVPPSRRRACAS